MKLVKKIHSRGFVKLLFHAVCFEKNTQFFQVCATHVPLYYAVCFEISTQFFQVCTTHVPLYYTVCFDINTQFFKFALHMYHCTTLSVLR